MQKIILLSVIFLFSNALWALSANNTCLPVFSDAVDQLGIFNKNMNNTIHTFDEIEVIVDRILDETLPMLIEKFDKTMPQISDKIDSLVNEVKATRKLAEERTQMSYVVGTTIISAACAAVFGALAYWTLVYLKNKWIPPAAVILNAVNTDVLQQQVEQQPKELEDSHV